MAEPWQRERSPWLCDHGFTQLFFNPGSSDPQSERKGNITPDGDDAPRKAKRK